MSSLDIVNIAITRHSYSAYGKMPDFRDKVIMLL